MLKLVTFIPTSIAKLVILFFKQGLIAVVISLVLLGIGGYYFYNSNTQVKSQLSSALNRGNETEEKLALVSAELESIKNTDQVKRNEDLQKEIKDIHDTYQKSISVYDEIQDLEAQAKKQYPNLEKDWANSVKQLSDRKLSDASTTLENINKTITAERAKLAPPPPPPAPPGPPAPANNTPPGSGYSRQSVTSDAGTFTVDIIAADMGSTKVIVDTASDSDCRNDCPVMALDGYVSRSGAFAGVNGSYFCPAAYPDCAGKTNSYDTLLMNKNKHYFNSDNNIYSTVPAAIFYSGGARFVGQSLEWGRDTGVDGVIANHPLLLAGGNVVFGGGSDPKQGSRGARSFVAVGQGKYYIGVVHNATVAEVARVLKAMGMSEALNLDSGGSTALWSGGYRVGPGRQIPNAVLFVRR